MIFYKDNPKESAKKLAELMSPAVAGYTVKYESQPVDDN